MDTEPAEGCVVPSKGDGIEHLSTLIGKCCIFRGKAVFAKVAEHAGPVGWTLHQQSNLFLGQYS